MTDRLLRHSHRSRLHRVAMLLLSVPLAASACSGDGESEPSHRETVPNASSPEPSTSEPSTSPGAQGSVSVGDEPWIVLQGMASLGLTLVRPDGTDQHSILDDLPGEQLHPDWSPDGSRLAFVHAADATSWNVWITDPAGDQPEPLVDSYPTRIAGLIWDSPAWSRDGSRIAMVGYQGNPDIELPSRSVLAIVDVETGEVTVALEASPADTGSLLSFPRWSPDDRALVLTADRFDHQDWTGSAIAVTVRDGAGWRAPKVITPYDAYAARPDWHPNDDLIVFATYDSGGFPSTDQPSNLFTIRPDGSELTPVTDFRRGGDRASQPTWTPDGRILFHLLGGPDDADSRVATVGADGSHVEVVLDVGIVGHGNRPHPRLRPVP